MGKSVHSYMEFKMKSRWVIPALISLIKLSITVALAWIINVTGTRMHIMITRVKNKEGKSVECTIYPM